MKCLTSSISNSASRTQHLELSISNEVSNSVWVLPKKYQLDTQNTQTQNAQPEICGQAFENLRIMVLYSTYFVPVLTSGRSRGRNRNGNRYGLGGGSCRSGQNLIHFAKGTLELFFDVVPPFFHRASSPNSIFPHSFNPHSSLWCLSILLLYILRLSISH
jgi:hypothetical protein